MPTWDTAFLLEMTARLALATLAGIVLGLNRWLHHKSAGIRTHSLVSLGAATAMLTIAAMQGGDVQASSRVLQGLVTGIGFLGAGVIIHEHNSQRIHGLTTAASLWGCALLGAAFGGGAIALGLLGLGFILVVLTFGGRLEEWTGRLMGSNQESEVPGDQDKVN